MRFDRRLLLMLLLTMASASATGCIGPFAHVPTRRLQSDTTLVLYRQKLYEAYPDSAYYIFLLKGYKIETDEGPDFSVTHLFFEGDEASRNSIGSAGIYSGMWPSRFGTKGFKARALGTITQDYPSPNSVWQLYESAPNWMMETVEGTHIWAEAPGKQKLMKWFEIFGTIVKDR